MALVNGSIGAPCANNFDCTGSTVKCFVDTSDFNAPLICRDTAEALAWGQVNFVAFAIIGIVFVLHFSCICYLRIKQYRSDLVRSRKKRQKQLAVEARLAAENGDQPFSMLDFGNFDDDSDEEGDDDEPMTEERMAELTALKEEGVKKRNTVKGELFELLDNSTNLIAEIREEASFVKVDTNVLLEERMKMATKYRIILLTFCRRNVFIALDEDEILQFVKDFIWMSTKLKNSKDASIKEGDFIINEVNEKLLQIDDELVGKLGAKAKKGWNLDWDLSDPDYQRLQSRVYTQLHPDDPYYQQMVIVANTPFQENETIMDEIKLARRSCTWHRKILRCLLPNFIAAYPGFYAVFYAIPIAICFMFLPKLGAYTDNLDLQNSALLGSTFLPIPPYYQVADIETQKYAVPLIYTVMHCALYCLAWIPIPFYKGILRDLSLNIPTLRTIMPIDDPIWLHKWIAIQLLSCLFVGGAIFFFEMNTNCAAPKGQIDTLGDTCQAFDPLPPAVIVPNNFAINPVQNVYMLRKIVWSTWFTVFPMLHWANTIPRFAPSFMKQYWYEIWFYSHHLIAHTSAFLALIARFEVFYPTLLPWGVYYLDKLREAIFKTARTEIIVRPVFVSGDMNPDDARTSKIHLDSGNKPVSMRVLIEVPPGFKVYAGQWIYLKIPSLSWIQWHPFSLASASRDNFVELHIGIRGDKSLWTRKKVGAGGEEEWVFSHRPTWTYKLYRELSSRIKTMAHLEDPERQADEVDPLFCMIRGPYGSTFTKCFDPHFYGSIIIGAGTGLTAAESVLRELIWRKRQKQRVPKYTWFVWSCSRVDDLLWAWGSLHDLLANAVEDGILKPGMKWSENSLMVDWLGIYFYVSRADKEKLKEFTTRVQKDDDDEFDEDGEVDEDRKASLIFNQNLTDLERQQKLNVKLHRWMASKDRLFTQSLDDKDAHIEKLFAWCRLFVNRKAGRHKKIALCFCGPPGLAHTLKNAAAKIGGSDNMQFTADSQ